MALIENIPIGNDSTVNGTDDREACQKFWIAAYTRPRSEKKTSSSLKTIGIETYLPLQAETRQWSDRKKKIEVVIIPNIIFANIKESDIDLIRQHPLITKILTMPGHKEPAHIPSEQIESLKFMLNKTERPIQFIPGILKKRDSVVVIRGSLTGLVGMVERISERKSLLIVSIDLLGGAMVEIDCNDIEMYQNQ